MSKSDGDIVLSVLKEQGVQTISIFFFSRPQNEPNNKMLERIVKNQMKLFCIFQFFFSVGQNAIVTLILSLSCLTNNKYLTFKHKQQMYHLINEH